MLNEVFLFWVAVFAAAAIAFIVFLDILFIVIWWRWEVVSAAHIRRKKARLRARRRSERFNKIMVPADIQTMVAQTQIMHPINSKEHERLYGAPW